MAVAALILSLVAIVVSVAAVWYAKQQAAAAQEDTFMNKTPDLRLSVEQTATPSADLIIDYAKGPDLSKVEVEIVIPADPPVRGSGSAVLGAWKLHSTGRDRATAPR